MTIQDWGSIGELIGGVAVIATLIYLAAQIRQNTAMITAQTVQASVDATQRVLLYRTEHPELRALLRKARAEEEELTPDEFETLACYLHATFMNFQARHHHNVKGLFDASVNESYEQILHDYLDSAYVRRWWSFARNLYGHAFRDHCDAIIRLREASSGEPIIDWEAAGGSKRPPRPT